MKKYTLEEIEAWRKMRKMGYSLGQIAMESGADINTIRYNTDEAYRLKTREKTASGMTRTLTARRNTPARRRHFCALRVQSLSRLSWSFFTTCRHGRNPLI